DVTPPLEEICLKAMAKNPEDRFADCQALADALGRWLESPAEVAVTATRRPETRILRGQAFQDGEQVSQRRNLRESELLPTRLERHDAEPRAAGFGRKALLAGSAAVLLLAIGAGAFWWGSRGTADRGRKETTTAPAVGPEKKAADTAGQDEA